MSGHLRRILLASTLIATVLILVGASGAWAATVVPNEGTVGTTLTISGSNFGAKQGTVFIGSIPTRVLAWSETEIKCLVTVPMPPGTYDLVVNPQGKASRETLPNAFAVRPPSINPPRVRPVFVSPGEEITIEGVFFGEGGLRKVKIETLGGEKRPCPVVNWAMDSITFKLPRGIPGIFHLEVTNGVGTDLKPWWGTFAEPPNEPPMPGEVNFTGDKTCDNATAVSYQNKLWFFFPGKDNVVRYRTWDGKTWSGTTVLVDTRGAEHSTYAPINPVVVDDFLYLFYTRLDGAIQIVKYNPLAVDSNMEPSPEWVNIGGYGSVKLYDNKGRFAAVYNHVRKYVEIYVTINSTSINKLVYYPDGSMYWSGLAAIQLDPAHPAIAPFLTAVFNGNEVDNDYVTYLSWDDTYAGAVSELKDGVLLHQTRSVYIHPYNSGGIPRRGPTLADMGEEYLAVMYNEDWRFSEYQKYDKKQHILLGYDGMEIIPLMSDKDAYWAPNGIVYSTKVPDSTSPTGFVMASRFYAIVENNAYWYEPKWQFVECEYLGYWKPTGPANYVDFQGRDLNNADAINQRLADTFPTWQVLGLIDMPPFVRNGNPQSTSSIYLTGAELSFTLASTNGLSGEYSVGPYVETGKKSRVTFDVSAGFAGGFENSTTFTYTTASGIEENLEGRILAFYLVPSFNVYTLEWFYPNGSPSGIYTQALEVLAPAIRTEAFDPEVGPDVAYYNGVPSFTPPYINVAKTAADIAAYAAKLPMHASEHDRERLDTYFRNPTVGPFNFASIVEPALSQSGWGIDSRRYFNWSIDQEHSVDYGGYCDLKIGAEVAKRIGFGVEGSVKILVKTKNQKSIEAKTNFNSQNPISPWPYTTPAVTSFNVEGYWLKPNASGYWVPNNRRGMGDAPWFVTYRVTDYHP